MKQETIKSDKVFKDVNSRHLGIRWNSYDYGMCVWHGFDDKSRANDLCGRVVSPGGIKKSRTAQSYPGQLVAKYEDGEFQAAYWVCDEHFEQWKGHNASGELYVYDNRFQRVYPKSMFEVSFRYYTDDRIDSEALNRVMNDLFQRELKGEVRYTKTVQVR